jgi:hypothetical protein
MSRVTSAAVVSRFISCPPRATFNLIWLVPIDWADFNANRRRHGLNDGELADPMRADNGPKGHFVV